jgi:hypothetical protein
VGRPPVKNSASTVPARIPFTVSGSDSRNRWILVSGLSPAASSIRPASTSVPELSELMDTRLPRMSATEWIFASLRTTTCMLLRYSRASARIGCGLPA